ncbi:MAG: DUF5671 domain-containing protein [Candidatus Paceibacterota bacterium]
MEWIKKIYIYLFSAVGLVLVIIGSVEIINVGLRAYVFTQADMVYDYPQIQRMPVDEKIIEPNLAQQIAYQEKTRTSNRQREIANAIALLVVGVPLFLFHWNIIRKNS